MGKINDLILKASAVSLLIFMPALYAQEQPEANAAPEALTFEKAMSVSIANSYDINIQRQALVAARGEYKDAKSQFDVTVGGSYEFAKKTVPYDEKDSYYISYGEKYDTYTSSLNLYAEKLFAFGLDAKVVYNPVSTRTVYDSKYYGSYDETSNRGDVALQLSLPLFKSFKDSLYQNKLDSAKLYLAQMESTLADKISQVMIQTSDAYWNYFLSYDYLQQLYNLKTRIEERNKNLQSLVNAGIRSKNDFLSMQVNLLENKRSIVNAENDLATKKLALAQAMGVDDINEIGVPEYAFPQIDYANVALPTVDEIKDEKINEIVLKRQDIQLLEYKLSAAEKKLSLAKISARPDVNLSFSLGASGVKQDTSVGSYFSSPFQNVHGVNIIGGIGVKAKIGPNSWTGAVESAEGARNAAKLQYDQQVSLISSQLRNVIETMVKQRNLVTEAQSVLDLQQQLYENEQRRFSAGLITTDTLFDKDTKYLSSKSDYYKILITYLKDVLYYKYYSGELVEIAADDFNSVEFYTAVKEE